MKPKYVKRSYLIKSKQQQEKHFDKKYFYGGCCGSIPIPDKK